MHVVLQTIFIIFWIAGLIGLVVGIWYGGSLLVLGVVSRLFPLTGRRLPPGPPDGSPTDSDR